MPIIPRRSQRRLGDFDNVEFAAAAAGGFQRDSPGAEAAKLLGFMTPPWPDRWEISRVKIHNTRPKQNNKKRPSETHISMLHSILTQVFGWCIFTGDMIRWLVDHVVLT